MGLLLARLIRRSPLYQSTTKLYFHSPPRPAAAAGPGAGTGADRLLLFLSDARRPRRPPPVEGRIPAHLKVNISKFENSAAYKKTSVDQSRGMKKSKLELEIALSFNLDLHASSKTLLLYSLN